MVLYPSATLNTNKVPFAERMLISYDTLNNSRNDLINKVYVKNYGFDKILHNGCRFYNEEDISNVPLFGYVKHFNADFDNPNDINIATQRPFKFIYVIGEIEKIYNKMLGNIITKNQQLITDYENYLKNKSSVVGTPDYDVNQQLASNFEQTPEFVKIKSFYDNVYQNGSRTVDNNPVGKYYMITSDDQITYNLNKNLYYNKYLKYKQKYISLLNKN